jgi:predicted enzyme related to lactoylglutathione lyase
MSSREYQAIGDCPISNPARTERTVMMSQSEQDRRIDYLEFAVTDITAAKAFYSTVFEWSFTDYGPEYTSFHDGRLGGGFSQAAQIEHGGPLVVLYSTDLEGIEEKIKRHGGEIVRKTFEFPGGRRFHFTDPAGNELAVWSDL